MLDLSQKKGLIICGKQTKPSVVYEIADFLTKNGVKLSFGYDVENSDENFSEFNPVFSRAIDVMDDHSMLTFFNVVKDSFESIDFVINDVSFFSTFESKMKYLNVSREMFLKAMEVNCYSFIKILSLSLPLFNYGGSYLGFSHYSARKWVPNYNVMSVVKSALEASVRSLACEVGSFGVRVNAISCEPVLSGYTNDVKDYKDQLDWNKTNSPLQKNATVQDVAYGIAYLISDFSTSITGEIIHIDGGYNLLGGKNIFAAQIKEDD